LPTKAFLENRPELKDEPMMNSKLMTLLKTFSVRDRERFRRFLVSPIFNENLEMLTLFEWLEQIMDDRNDIILTKENTWQKLYVDQTYNDDRLRRLFSELNKLAMDYLAFEQYQNDPASDALYLLPALNKIALSKHFVGVVRQAKDQLRKDGYQNARYHFSAYQVESQSSTYLEQTQHKNRELEHSNLADFHLDCFYIIQKLWHYIGLLMLKYVRFNEVEFHLFPDFLQHIANSKFMQVPTIRVYYNIVLVFLYPEEEHHFYDLKKLVDEQGHYFTKEELQKIYVTAQNYCAYKINAGNINYYRELFNINKTLIDKSLISSDGEIAPGNYKNIITVGLMVDESAWVESFIQEYSQYLPKANQDNDLNYNLAKVYFHEKNYHKVIAQLREVEYKNLLYSLGGKLMLLKTYYELKEGNALDSLIDSFRIYLHRNQEISLNVRQQYLNVLRFVRKLPLEKSYDKAALQKLKQQIEGCKALAAKQWLLEKVVALS
jgi:hypothetical protein